jgi:transcription antitermination factor NusG
MSNTPSMTSELTPQWYAISTMPRHEKHVAGMLHEREVESFLPIYVTQRLWKKRAPVTLALPLFPTYLFARITPNRRSAVLSTPGVTSIVGNSRQSLAVPDAEIDALRTGQMMDSYEPHPYLATGERVRIKNGVFADMEGILVRKNNCLKVVLTIGPILQGVAVTVESSAIEPIFASA